MGEIEKKDNNENTGKKPYTLDYFFKYIENYFKIKEKFIKDFKHIPIEEIIKNAPKYYPVVRLFEVINVFLSKDKSWLQHFVENNKINFEWKEYERWKAGKSFSEGKYDETVSPSKWIHVLQEFFIDLLKDIQILLMMEFYIDEEDYKKFIKKDSQVYYKTIANYVSAAKPSEDLLVFFKVIDILLKINMENNFTTNMTIDTALCIKIYRDIDQSKIFDILKKKEFYIKYHVEYLKKTAGQERSSIPYEEDIVKVADKFLLTLADLRFTYNKYKSNLIEKKDNFMKKMGK